jgi:hypothetical protein
MHGQAPPSHPVWPVLDLAAGLPLAERKGRHTMTFAQLSIIFVVGLALNTVTISLSAFRSPCGSRDRTKLLQATAFMVLAFALFGASALMASRDPLSADPAPVWYEAIVAVLLLLSVFLLMSTLGKVLASRT